MEGENGVTRRIIDEPHSSHIEGDQIECESSVTRSIIDELYSSDIQNDQIAGECGATRSIIDELNSWDVQGDQMEGESMVLLKVSLMNLILGIFKEIKWKLKAWCYSQYH